MDRRHYAGRRGEGEHWRRWLRSRICSNDSGPGMRFGRGIHHCLGAPLARLGCRIAIEMLLERISRLKLLGDRPKFRKGIVLWGLQSLMVRCVPASGAIFVAFRQCEHNAVDFALQGLIRFDSATAMSIITAVRTGNKKTLPPVIMGYGLVERPQERTLSWVNWRRTSAS